MAEVTAVNSGRRDYRFHVWSGMAGGDVGVGVNTFRYSTRTVQSYLGPGGQWGTSSLFFEGSNNSTNGINGNWSSLTDGQGNDVQLAVNSGHFELLAENPFWVRPRAGTGTGSLMAVAFFGVR